MIPFYALCREIRRRTDAELADFDPVGPWDEIAWFWRPFARIFDHQGSLSWADHFGLRGYNYRPGGPKTRRRIVANLLSVWETQRWFVARGDGD